MFITSYVLHVSVFVTPTLTEVFPCFFPSCKANARAKPAKTGHGPHSSKFLCFSMYVLCCSMYCLFCVVLCIVCVYMCTELPPPGGYPITVNKYIVSYILLAEEQYVIESHLYIPYSKVAIKNLCPRCKPRLNS